MSNENFMQNAEKRRRLIRAGYIVAGILAAILVAASLYHTVRRTASRFTRDFMSPFIGLSGSVSNMQTEAKLLSQSKMRLADSLMKMEKQNLELAAASVENKILQEENRELRGLLRIKADPRFQPVMTRVTARSGDTWQSRFMIDAGESEGISAGDLVAATAPDGRIAVAGRILNTSHHTSVVATCYSDEFKLSVSAGPNQECGILEYDSSSAVPRIRYLPVKTTVKIADLVQTSGIPQNTPGGVRIGRIIPCGDDRAAIVCDKLFSVAYLRPFIQPDVVRFAVVFTRRKGGK